MLTPTLQEIVDQIRQSSSSRNRMKYLPGNDNPQLELLNVLEQMDFFEAQLHKAYEEGGLAAAARVIIRPANPNCLICGRTLL